MKYVSIFFIRWDLHFLLHIQNICMLLMVMVMMMMGDFEMGISKLSHNYLKYIEVNTIRLLISFVWVNERWCFFSSLYSLLMSCYSIFPSMIDKNVVYLAPHLVILVIQWVFLCTHSRHTNMPTNHLHMPHISILPISKQPNCFYLNL